MKTKAHAVAGALALLTICIFWCATAATELFGDAAAIASVKKCIVAGMLVLIPAMAVAGALGLSLGRGWRSPAVERKKRRMKIAAANGILILIPSAVFLAGRAEAGAFDAAFATVQALELIAGAVNITLLSLNMRDGLALRRKPARPASGPERMPA
ncbi:hypothetical protein ABUE31_05860 [Mesorhizobium sp. ZMM04-5]|uniref:Lipoprotein n=1 Tax=Mesorhizobium marinum TaxID=3228790 RepID=A0ABV3QYV4_9HYPH